MVSLQPPRGEVVAPSFFASPSDQVAPRLLGTILWFSGVGGGRLTEVEAYLPEDDPACHAYRGLTRRNAAMFGPPGTIYVFQSYGVHMLLNLVCDREGVGSAVLIRSFEPLGDTSVLEANRRRAGRVTLSGRPGGAAAPKAGPRPRPRLCGSGSRRAPRFERHRPRRRLGRCWSLMTVGGLR